MASTKYYITTVSWYNQLRIKSKALVGISIICLLIVIGISLSIHLVNKIHEETREIHNKWIRSILKVSEMMGQLDDIVKLESKYASAITQNEKSLVEDK